MMKTAMMEHRSKKERSKKERSKKKRSKKERSSEMERTVKAEGQKPPAPAVAEVAVAPDQPHLTTPTNAEPAPLIMAERVAAADKKQNIEREKFDLAAEAPDDAPSNWITPADARATDSAATRTKAGTKKATIRTVRSTFGNMKTALKTLRPTKPQNTTTYLPSATVTAILDHLLDLIPALHVKYARYDEVDAAM